MLRLLTRVGRRRAAHATSSGKCLLAFGAPAESTADRGRSPPAGAADDHDAPAVERTLADVRANGYAVSIDESAPGVASVAAPVFDAAGGASRPCPWRGR